MLHLPIAEQPVEAFQRRADAFSTRKMPGQFHQRQTRADDQRFHGEEKIPGIAYIQTRNNRGEIFLQYFCGVHGGRSSRLGNPEEQISRHARVVFA